ncbi:Transcriptional regulatory protein sin3 [Tyrophagus putrescentiae]|nr:Transcriptional regulatory protein sin3 [Tyrophagus putrescentiae]
MDSSSSPIQSSTSPSSQSPSALLPMQPSTSPSPPPPPPPQPPASVSPSPPPPQPPSQSSQQQQVDNSSTTTAENIVEVVPLNMKQIRELERAVKLNQTVKSTCSREVYEAFHERLKAFRHDQADSKEVIQDICRLFADRPALLKGFKYFVPEWYLQPDDYVPLEEEEDYDGDEDDDDEEEEDDDKG